MNRALDFVDVQAARRSPADGVTGVRADGIDKGRGLLEKETIRRLEELVRDTLATYGYA